MYLKLWYNLIMIIDKEKIYKLKILIVKNNCLIVENILNQKGSIFIGEISKSYIVDLNKLYSKGDIIYAYLIKEDNSRRYYSLKIGHTSNSKYVNEYGGGYLGLIYQINKHEKNLKI